MRRKERVLERWKCLCDGPDGKKRQCHSKNLPMCPVARIRSKMAHGGEPNLTLK